jgi:hypothetical protein
MKEMTQRLLEGMRKEVGKTIRKVDSCRDITGETFKGIIRNGMENIVKAVEGVLIGLSEALDGERQERKVKEENSEQRLQKIVTLEEECKERVRELGEKVKEVEENQKADQEVIEKVGEAMVREKKFCRLRDSVRIIEGQVEEATCKVKVVGIKLEKATDDRKEIVRMALDQMKKDVGKESQERFGYIIKNTKIVVLGKETSRIKKEDELIHSAPILLICQNKGEKEEVERMLRKAGCTTLFYWPDSMVDFVRGGREELRRKGFEEGKFDVRIRPERRDGRFVIRVDIRSGAGGRFRPEAYWRIPGDRKLLDQLGINVYSPLDTNYQ